MNSLLIYAMVTPALYYLGSRALITRFLWSNYPPALALFMDCAACSGAWYGAIMGYVGGYHLGLPFLGVPGDFPWTIAVIALCSMTWTPIIAGLVQRGFDTLGHTAPIEDLPEAEPDGEG